jgi:gas vesicle protein
MSDERSAGPAGIILSFLLGSLTGAALAILFAPRSGKETRELLSERIREGAEKGRDLRDRVTTRGRELVDDAAELVEKSKESIERKKDRLAAAVEAGRQAYREEKERG